MAPITEALAKLIKVKSIVTIVLTIGFLVQAVRGQLNEQFMSVYLVVVSFYFGTQSTRARIEAEYPEVNIGDEE